MVPGDTGGQHEEGPAPRALGCLCWQMLVTKFPGLQGFFPSPQRSGSGRAARVGDAGPRFPFPPCPPAPSISLPAGNRLCTPGAEHNPSRVGDLAQAASTWHRCQLSLWEKGCGHFLQEPDTNVLGHSHRHQAGSSPPLHRSLLVPKSGSPSPAAGIQQGGNTSWLTRPSCLCELTQG